MIWCLSIDSHQTIDVGGATLEDGLMTVTSFRSPYLWLGEQSYNQEKKIKNTIKQAKQKTEGEAETEICKQNMLTGIINVRTGRR